MEIESEDGSTIAVEHDSLTKIGRLSLGFRRPSFPDRSVSRRHLCLQLVADDSGTGGSGDESRVAFEIVGRNPILVCRGGGGGGGGGGGKAKVYRNGEKGELGARDRFSLSLKNPSFWVIKRRGGGSGSAEQTVLDAVKRREKRTSDREERERKAKVEASESGAAEEADIRELQLELGTIDISQIDPIKEFGFLVEGHEFDHYPKHKIRPAKEWNWFLEEGGRSSDVDDELTDEETTLKRNRMGKMNKKNDDDDEEWTDENENFDGNASKSKYSTRSKDLKRPRTGDLSGAKNPAKGRNVNHRKEVDDEEGDETLGGFIVNDDDEEEADEEELEVEEEDFDEDEDDD